MNVAVIGLWHLGMTYAAAQLQLGNQVLFIDEDLSIIKSARMGVLPLYEPGIDDTLMQGKESGALIFSEDLSTLEKYDLIFICFDTDTESPLDQSVNRIFELTGRVIQHANINSTIVICSQLPLGSTRSIIHKYVKEISAKRLNLGYHPENLRLGDSLNSFFSQTYLLFGFTDCISQERIKQCFLRHTGQVVFSSAENAELLKHATNSFLAMCISFSNELSNIANFNAANYQEITELLRLDPRIGPKAYLSPGLPFSGTTLERDLLYVDELCKKDSIDAVLLKSILVSNTNHLNRCLALLQNTLSKGKKVGFLGITYKAKSSTLRGSLFLKFITALNYPRSLLYWDEDAEFRPELVPHKVKDLQEFLSIVDEVWITKNLTSDEFNYYKQLIRDYYPNKSIRNFVKIEN